MIPAKKSRGKVVKKEASIKKEDESMQDVDDVRGPKKESVDEPVVLSAPEKKSRAKKGTKKTVKEEVELSEEAEQTGKKAPIKKSRSKKLAIKAESPVDDDDSAEGNEQKPATKVSTSAQKSRTKKERKSDVAVETVKGIADGKDDSESTAVQPKKGRQSKRTKSS